MFVPSMSAEIIQSEESRKTVLEYESKYNITIFKVQGRLDLPSCPELEESFRSFRDQGKIMLLGDCTDLTYINSAAMRVLLSTARDLYEIGGKMVIFGLNDRINKLFEITGIPNVIPLADTFEEGLGLLLNKA